MEISAPDFDLEKTLDSGQVFHWEKIGNGFIGMIGDLPIYVEQRANTLKAGMGKLDGFKPSTLRVVRETESLVSHRVAQYFALDHPLAEVCASFPDDPVMKAAQDFCRGLRIIRQPKWECLAMFICSSMKQVAHIRQISKALRNRFGNICRIDPPMVRQRTDSSDRRNGFAAANNCTVHTFPQPLRIAEASVKELRECALGYRAKNLLATARLVAAGDVDLEQISDLSDVDLRRKLCELPGVGAKIANCVMLFAYERLRAFPIDVWIERILRQKYFPRARKLNASRLQAFTKDYFGEWAGYAQQYLFHHARMSGNRSVNTRTRIRRHLSGC